MSTRAVHYCGRIRQLIASVRDADDNVIGLIQVRLNE